MFDEKGAFIRQYYLEYTIDDLDITGMGKKVCQALLEQ